MPTIKRAIKRIGLIALVLCSVTVGSVAAWNEADPDNPIANQIQFEQAKKVPGELIWISPPGPVAGKMLIVLVHGWTPGGWLSREEVIHTFEPMLINWRGLPAGTTGVFVNDFGVRFDDRFSVVAYRYDTSVSPDENGRRLWKLLEGNPEITLREIQILPIGHSMGGIVAQGYRVIEEHKLQGMIGVGVPINGSPADDLVAVTAWANKVFGKIYGPKLVTAITNGIDFETDGIRWLAPNFPPRRQLFEAEPLDENCYLYAGAIKPVPIKAGPILWNLVGLFDAAKLQGDDYQKAMIAYPFAASMIEGLGGGPNDGMVPRSSALYASKAVLCDLGDCNHTQVIRGAGNDYEIHRKIAHGVWAIYQKTIKHDPQFGVFDIALPNWEIGNDLKGFGIKLGQPVSVWWQSGGQVFVLGGKAAAADLKITADTNREVAVDATGWRMAVPSSNGINVFNFQAGEAHRILEGCDVRAVGWHGGKLLAVYNHALWLISEDQQIERVMVRDEKLSAGSRLVVAGETVYLASNASAGKWDVYKIPVSAHQWLITDKRISLIQAVAFKPRLAKSSVLGIYQEGGRSKIEWLSAGWLGPVRQVRPVIDKLITEDILGAVTDVAVTSQDEVYLIIDGRVCQLNMDLAKLYAMEGLALVLAAKQEGRPEATMVVDLERLVSAVGAGVNLGAR
jgi:pimeloyl-ACP methyl ester carboxylesterase